MGNNKITGLGTPTADTDASTKLYVDSAKFYTDLTPTTAPTAVEGRMYYDNATDSLRYYNGIEWLFVGSRWEQPLMTSATTPSP